MTDLHSLLVNEAPIAIAALSMEGKILFWNKTAESLFGFTSQEAIGQSIHALIVPGLREEESKTAIEKALIENFSYESIRRDKKGNEFIVQISLTPCLFGGSRIVITTMQPVPEKDIRRKDLLETSEFISNMSHELRTPLNSIIGFTELLVEDTSGSLNARQKEYMVEVLKGGKQLLNLINTILDLAKLDTGKISVVPEEFDVQATVEQVLSIFSPVVDKNNIQLQANVSEECRVVRLDQNKFRQVLYYLISCAISMTQSGHRIETMIRKSGDEKLEMTITSPGREESEERGLDLLLVRKILELQNGSLSVENIPGMGATFTVRLPMPYALSA